MKKQQVPSGRFDAQAQMRMRTNTLHAPLDRSVNCLPHGVFETGPDDRVTEWSIIFPCYFLSAFVIPLRNTKKLPNILFHRWPGLYLALPGSPAFILCSRNSDQPTKWLWPAICSSKLAMHLCYCRLWPVVDTSDISITHYWQTIRRLHLQSACKPLIQTH